MNPIDAELLPVAELIDSFVDLDVIGDETGTVQVTSLACDLPVEIGVAREDDAVTLRFSPPRQPIITTVMPVLHRLRLTVVARADD